jgi:hypothetical protein
VLRSERESCRGGFVDKKTPLDDHAVAERLVGLLDYVDALIKLDERVAARLSQHKLQDGSQFILHEHELTKLPGISLNKSDDEGPIWLRAQRLQRTAPPLPDEKVAEWIEVSQNPDVACSILPVLHKRFTGEEKETLVEQGKLRPEDCSPSLKEEKSNNQGAHFDVFFRLEDQPETQQACGNYVSNVWATWAERELSSPLAIALSRAEPEDEVTVQLDGETRRLMFVALESAEKEAA